MNCLEIVRKHLEENGFAGLQILTGDGCVACECNISDLAPCKNNFSQCTPYKIQSTGYEKNKSDQSDQKVLIDFAESIINFAKYIKNLPEK